MSAAHVSRNIDSIRVITANMDFNNGGDLAYIRHLRSTYSPAILCMQERTRGKYGTRIRGLGIEVKGSRRRNMGRNGSHRAVVARWVRITGQPTRVLTAHGLHRGTVGFLAQEVFLRILAAWIRRLTRRGVPWILAGDFNRHHLIVARLMGGKGVGSGVDGVIVSPLLDVELETVDETALKRGWSDHPAVVARVSGGKP